MHKRFFVKPSNIRFASRVGHRAVRGSQHAIQEGELPAKHVDILCPISSLQFKSLFGMHQHLRIGFVSRSHFTTFSHAAL